jgi:ferric-dicitrate binding protein FerR (iron transport regulator)
MDEKLIRYVSGRATPAEAAEVERWLEQHESHRARLTELTEVWEATSGLAHEAQGATVPIDQVRQLVAARLLIDRKRSSTPVESLDAGPLYASGPAGRQRGAPGSLRPVHARVPRSLSRIAAVLALLIAGSLLGPSWGILDQHVVTFGLEEVRTVAGEMATAELVDGTVVRLGPESILRFAGSDDRAVWLEGRAFFSVHHDPDEPFRVETPAGEAMVLGTRFDIQVRAEGLQVSVVEGVVEMNAGPGPVRVEAGHVGRLSGGRDVEVSREEDILRRLDWVGQFIAFERTPLTQVAREVERLYGLPVEIRGDELAGRTVTGAYEGRTFQQTLEVICLVVGAHCQIGESGAVIQP